MTPHINQDTLEIIESLYASYCLLNGNNDNGRPDLSHGSSAIYEKLIEILKQDDIYCVIVRELGDIFEDYIHNVPKDTPAIICVLKKAMENQETKGQAETNH